jgi:hypothetical protein
VVLSVPSSVVTVETFDIAASFFYILLGIWSELIEQSVLHGTIVDHDVRGQRSDILDSSLKICCDRKAECAEIPLGKSLAKRSLYSSNLSSLFFLASFMSYCCL